MKPAIFGMTLVGASVVAYSAIACEGKKKTGVQQVTLQEAEKADATFVDSNNEMVRKKFGTIPGAVLLTSYAAFEAKELPSDKDEALIFYCANDLCSAAKVSASKAKRAGHVNVAVLPDGIMGWKKAGKKTADVPRS